MVEYDQTCAILAKERIKEKAKRKYYEANDDNKTYMVCITS